MLEKLARFMYGRYGGDKLNIFILIVGFVFSLLSNIFSMYIFYIISYVLWFYALWRMFSRNIPARQKEYRTFLNFYVPWEKWFKYKKTTFSQRKTYKYFKCPKCKQKLRAPRNRGNITVTCQKCHYEFKKKV